MKKNNLPPYEPNTKEPCHHNDNHPRSYQAHKKKILDGLRQVEGQVRGIIKMVEEERYCVEVLTQIAAARMALAGQALLILEDHTKGCVSKAIQEQDQEKETIEELMAVIKKLL